MSTDKPSKSEEEYFTKRDLELLKKKRAQIATEAQAAERQSHYMKCPKCGADLLEEQFHGISIERCPECQGIWLDAGEVENLMSEKKPGLLARVFGDVTASLREND